jgi:hypothetical protein
MAQLPPGKAEALFEELAAMTPSWCSLDRLPRERPGLWEAKRDAWKNALLAQETVPEAAVSVAFSRDGVTPHLTVAASVVAMNTKAAQRLVKQTEARKHASGPAGHQAAGCATVTGSIYAGDGERLRTIRYARMPEGYNPAPQAQLHGEAQALLATQLDLRRVHLADGTEGNWKLLAEVERALGLAPETRLEIVDFYHACDQLKNGCDAI